MIPENKKLCIGKILAPHGLHGHVKIQSFTQKPEDLVKYGQLCDKSGKHWFQLHLHHTKNKTLIAHINGIQTRSQAKNLQGLDLFIPRSVLPDILDEDTYYYTDLIGLNVESQDGIQYGTVKAIHDFPSGTTLEIGHDLLLLFTRQYVLHIDLEKGKIIIQYPQTL